MDTPGNSNSAPFAGINLFSDLSALAYVRPVTTDQGTGFAVCAADGTQLAVFSTRDAAYFAARQHDLEPVLTH